MNLKKITFGLLVSLVSVQAAAFSDIGTSKTSCSSAKRDAQVIAQSHCYSLDTKPKLTMGSCTQRKLQGKKQYRVPVYYKCMVQTASFDYE
ncbi:MAG: hypothetical protein V4596_03270 [Bdellovibrionota bacterium]